MADLFKEIWAVLESRIRFGVKPGLDRMHAALQHLKHPQRHFSSVLIAGTNGKGSTASCLEQLLGARGLRTGLFLSPHLLHPGERVAVGGRCLDSHMEHETCLALEKAWAELKGIIEPLELSYFECLTLLALLVFRHGGVEWAILECGMGGCFDATNAVDPDLSILTSVGLDHLEWLGGSLESVARDKAGIARLGQPFLASLKGLLQEADSEADSVVEEIVRAEVLRRGGRFIPSVKQLVVPLDSVPKPLRNSAALALQAVDILIQEGAVEPGTVRSVVNFQALPGRFDLRFDEPPLLLDVAHNQPALKALCQAIEEQWPERRFQVFFAAMEDKMLVENVLALSAITDAITPVVFEGHRRAASLAQLQAAFTAAGVNIAGLDPAGLDAVKPCHPKKLREETLAYHAKGIPVLVTGSFLSVASWLGAEELPPGL
jgi:dihydrofolate synthase / folylpolyglutamate synthase